MNERFRVEFMEEAAQFLEELPAKTREKVLYNIWKSRNSNDKELFKKLTEMFGNSEHYTKKPTSVFLHFGTKEIIQTLLLFQHMELSRRLVKCQNLR